MSLGFKHRWQALKLRQKLLYTNIALSGLLVLLTASLSLLLAYIIEDSIFERLLQYQVEQYEGRQNGNRSDAFIQRYDSQTQLPPAVQTQLRNIPEAREFPTDDGHFHLRIAEGEQGQQGFWLARVDSLLSVRQSRWAFASGYGMILVLMMLLAFFVYRALSRAILAPLETLAEKCLPEKKPAVSEHQTDEVEHISSRLHQIMAELDASLQRERDFSRDIGHELRTPISILKNTIDIELKDHPSQHRLEQLYQQLHLTIDSLMSLAKQEGLESQHFNLTETVENVVLEQARSKSSQFDIELPDVWKVHGDPILAAMLLRNLIANAHEHGDHKQSLPSDIHIKSQKNTLIISNPISAELYQALDPKRIQLPGEHRQHSSGIGQGLYLVRRICEQLAWQFDFQFHADKEAEKDINSDDAKRYWVQCIVRPNRVKNQ